MPSSTDKLARYRERYRALQAKVSEIGFIYRGSLQRRFTVCGKPGCRCNDDPSQRHGPYWQWTTKIEGKTVTKRLTPDEAKLYREWMANARKLDRLIAEMEDLSRRAATLAVHR